MTTYFYMNITPNEEGYITPRAIDQTHADIVDMALANRQIGPHEKASYFMRENTFSQQLALATETEKPALLEKQAQYRTDFRVSLDNYLKIKIGKNCPHQALSDPRFVKDALRERREAVSEGGFPGVEKPRVNDSYPQTFGSLTAGGFSSRKGGLKTVIESPPPVKDRGNPSFAQDMLAVVVISYGAKVLYDGTSKERRLVVQWIKKIFE